MIEEAHLAAAKGLLVVAALDSTVYIHLFATGMHVCVCVVAKLHKGRGNKTTDTQSNQLWGVILVEATLVVPLLVSLCGSLGREAARK